MDSFVTSIIVVIIRILPGGAASGFKHVTDEFHPALYSIKGKRNPIVRQLAEVSWSLMNEGDVFVIDCKKYIFVWVGRSANNMEKMHAAKVRILNAFHLQQIRL